MKTANDTTIMPFGKYAGVALGNIPAGYLIWLYDNFDFRYKDLYLKNYIKENMDVLIQESKKNNKKG